jgi:hypothetical protein
MRLEIGEQHGVAGTPKEARAVEHDAPIGAQWMQEQDRAAAGRSRREPGADAPAGRGRDEGGVARFEIGGRRPDRRARRPREQLADEQRRGRAGQQRDRGEGGEAPPREDGPRSQ